MSEMSSTIPDIASSSSALITASVQGIGSGIGGQAVQGGQGGQGGRGGRGGQGGRGGRGGQGGRGGKGGRKKHNGGHSKKVFNNSRRPKFRGSFQVIQTQVIQTQSNDQTQYSKTLDKLKEHIKTAYNETCM